MYNYLLRPLFVIDGLQDIIKWLFLYEYSVKVSVDDTVHKKWCTIYIDKIPRLYKTTLSNSFSVLVNLSSLFLFFSSSTNGFIMQLFFIFEVSILRFGVSFKCTRHSIPSSFLGIFQTLGLFLNLKHVNT